jgi:hypothetical protein
MPIPETAMAAEHPESADRPAGANPAGAASPGAASPGGTTAPAGSGAAQAQVVRLLLKAVATLPEAERDQVYAWFMDRAIAGPGSLGGSFTGAGPLPRQLREMSATLLSLQAAGGLPGTQPAGQQVVPVRFAADQHAVLRTWCSEHGFSMATVIRGLVSRFLEGQLPARN